MYVGLFSDVQGTPGCFYILARRPVTPAKLRMDAEMRMFWQLLGTFMSSLGFGQPTTLHLMESNCAGNKQGEEVCGEGGRGISVHSCLCRVVCVCVCVCMCVCCVMCMCAVSYL